MLVQYGAAVNRTDRNGCTPLYKAAYHGRPVLVDMLVKAGRSTSQCCDLYIRPLHAATLTSWSSSSYCFCMKNVRLCNDVTTIILGWLDRWMACWPGGRVS